MGLTKYSLRGDALPQNFVKDEASQSLQLIDFDEGSSKCTRFQDVPSTPCYGSLHVVRGFKQEYPAVSCFFDNGCTIIASLFL